jgi:hypothetical protein
VALSAALGDLLESLSGERDEFERRLLAQRGVLSARSFSPAL